MQTLRRRTAALYAAALIDSAALGVPRHHLDPGFGLWPPPFLSLTNNIISGGQRCRLYCFLSGNPVCSDACLFRREGIALGLGAVEVLRNRAKGGSLEGFRGFRAIGVVKNRLDGECLGGSVEEFRGVEEVRDDSRGVGEEGSDVKAHKAVGKAVRRRTRDGSSIDVTTWSAELLSIPGIGPRNLRKLVDNGFRGLDQLKQLYRDKFFDKSSENMVEYLKSSVRIIHKNHAESIASFVKEKVDEEFQSDTKEPEVKRAQNERLTFCVEGNISVGKTTFLQRVANETVELRDLVEIVPEPVSKWQDIGPYHFNILDAFYADPQRYAYTFQNYIFVTRVMQERESSGGLKPVRLMERSVFSDRMVFVRAVHEAKWMNELEINIYNSWFNPVVSLLPGLIPAGFIYLRASPDACYKRMMCRNRSEEGGVSLDYLKDLHEKHENWLFPSQEGKHGVFSVTKLPMHIDSTLHPDIRERVVFLEGANMHPSIEKMPALVLDCEPSIDFTKDIEAKRQYARQVAEFFTFVKKQKEVSSAARDTSKTSISTELLFPRDGALRIPKRCSFP